MFQAFRCSPSRASLVLAPFRSLSSKAPRRLQDRTKKDPIIVTPSAADRIKHLISNSSKSPPPIGIRLGVKKRGCNGLSYTMNYTSHIPPQDEYITSHGVTVCIDPGALFNVVGTVMDWKEDDLSAEFVFENPNSKGECGCGESFNV